MSETNKLNGKASEVSIAVGLMIKSEAPDKFADYKGEKLTNVELVDKFLPSFSDWSVQVKRRGVLLAVEKRKVQAYVKYVCDSCQKVTYFLDRDPWNQSISSKIEQGYCECPDCLSMTTKKGVQGPYYSMKVKQEKKNEKNTFERIKDFFRKKT